MRHLKIAPIVLIALAALGSTGARAQSTNLLSDGDFENFISQVGSGSYTTYGAGSSLGAWLVSGTSVDLVRNGYGSITDVSVDLAGTPGPGYISQSFTAVAGTTYTLAWDQYRNIGSTDSMLVSFGGSTTTYNYVTAVTHESLSWTATSSGLQTVEFGTAVANLSGPTLDNVVLSVATPVSPVPEPQTGMLLLGGLGCMGFVARRRSAS